MTPNNATFPLESGGNIEIPRSMSPVVVDKGATVEVRVDGQTYVLACTKEEFDLEFNKSLADQHKLTTVKDAHPPLDHKSPNGGYGLTGAEARNVRVPPVKQPRNAKYDARGRD